MTRHFEDIETGEIHDLGTYTADREEMIAFARRYDPQPIHVDPEAAADTIYGGLIASGWHTAGSCMRLVARGFLNDAASIGSFGLDDLRWTAPVRPGDTVSVTLDVAETRESDSHDDRGALLAVDEHLPAEVIRARGSYA
jgi:acyl dehydratase